MINMDAVDSIELIDVHVNNESNSVFTFGLTYRLTYKCGKIEEIELPRVTSPFYEDCIAIHQNPFEPKRIDTMSQCVLKPFMDKENDIEYYLKRKIIKEADPVEMTMDEIEAALGKRVKIVNKGDKK